jgi:catechol 2,3-dioxygenase-like lactoylglutathione lyase family enzyme
VGKAHTWHRTVTQKCSRIRGVDARLSFRIAVRGAARESLAVSVLHHLALGTRDVAGLARFYIDVLGLREVTRHLHADGSLRSVWLDLGGALLMIERTDEPPRTVAGVGAGPFLIAVAVSVEARPDFEARLEGAGSIIEFRSEFTSYARDPDGNRVALSAYPLTQLERG